MSISVVASMPATRRGNAKLVIEHMSYYYYLEREDTEFLAFSDVSLSMADGEFVAIVGPSGRGKTTLLNVMAGLRD